VRRLLQTCCVFLLLFAQQAALTHLLWHAQRTLVVERLDAATAQAKRSTGTPHIAALCSFHALLGQVLGAAPCDARPRTERFVTAETPHRYAREAAHRYFPAPLSRGPPAPLVF
jgi:hypothetical protein